MFTQSDLYFLKDYSGSGIKHGCVGTRARGRVERSIKKLLFKRVIIVT